MSKVYQIITDRIVAELKKGTVPWRKPWAAAGFGAAVAVAVAVYLILRAYGCAP